MHHSPTILSLYSFANPTALGVITFSLSVTIIAGYLLGFQGTSAESMPVSFGMFFLSSGLGLTLAGIFEFIVGNTCELAFLPTATNTTPNVHPYLPHSPLSRLQRRLWLLLLLGRYPRALPSSRKCIHRRCNGSALHFGNWLVPCLVVSRERSTRDKDVDLIKVLSPCSSYIGA